MKRLGWLAFAVLLPLMGGALAGSPVAVCGLSGTAGQSNCVIPNADGSLNIGGVVGSPVDTNLTEIGGIPVNVGSGTGGSATQRVLIDSSQVVASGTAGSAASQVLTVQGIASMTPVQVTETPLTAGGLSVYFVQPTAGDNHVVIKAGAGQVYKITVTNNSATVNYLRLYNATTGFNGCNSATNLQYQVAIPASTTVGGIADSWDSGMAFATGISICVTSGYATNDVTNATASAMSVNIGYK